MLRRVLSLLLCLVLLVSIPVTVFAEEVQQEETIPEEPRVELEVFSVNTFLQFAKNCRLDSYSRNMNVILKTDIDLSGTDFEAIPIFCGSFDGNGHTISGLEITTEGSVQGLFRYLEEGAQVKNLNVSGKICPDGSKEYVGGIVGSNAGVLSDCTFTGTVVGGDYVGGIAGVNTLTGVIDGCSTEGQISGNHFVGGVAGENQGVLRKCVNNSLVNTTPTQNTVELADISLQTLTGSEAANTVTDVGGIAGTGTGVIRSCANWGEVGYPQMGYNVGGIAGSFMGYITDCRNYTAVSGRKEVGGIVGQMEPVTKIEYMEDTLQILDEQLDAMSALTNQAAANAQGGAAEVTNQVAQMQKQLEDAQKALDSLMPEQEPQDPQNPQLPQLPEEDALLAAQNALSGSLSGIQQNLSSIAGATQSAAGTLASDMQAIATQAGQMGQTLDEAAENVGGSVEDVSDLDTAEDLTGKISDCTNWGAVLADLNAGGVAGAISIENDLDPEKDLNIFGEMSMNVDTQLRAVILRCENDASVTAKKQNAGGIVGWMQMGLAKNCESYGTIEGAQYTGGVVGYSQGYVRGCSAKCAVTGTSYVGGIAGSGKIVSDCRSMTLLNADEKLGEVLGVQEQSQEETPVVGNFYCSVGQDLGGIDAVSYDGQAQRLKQKEFLALEDLSDRFQYITVRFVFEDGRTQSVPLEPGQELQEQDIPQIPQRDGYVGQWKDLYTDISFDEVFTLEYTALTQVRQSRQLSDRGLPVLLMECVHTENQLLDVNELTEVPAMEEGKFLLGWQFPRVCEDAVVRCLLPEDIEGQHLQVLLLGSDGLWRSETFFVDGSYVVAETQKDDQAIAVLQLPPDYTLWYIAGAVAALIVILVLVISIRKRKRKKQVKTA